MKYDVIVIGGGPGGYHAAIQAASQGLHTLLIEKGALGGVCLNEGCIPTKTLLYSAKLYDNAANGDKYGVHVEGASLDHRAVLRRKAKVTRVLGAGVKSALAEAGVTCIQAKAKLENRYKATDSEPCDEPGRQASAGDIAVLAGGDAFHAENIILATGSQPVLPGIPGVAEARASGFLLTSREILSLDEVPKSLAVVGGGVIGLEMAYYYSCAGSRVTVIELLPEIGGTTDTDISAVLVAELGRKGITILTRSMVTDIGSDSLSYKDIQTGDTNELACDKVLMAVGRAPNVDGLGLSEVGIEYSRSGIATDDFCRTNLQGIYAIGDANGKSMLAHTAYREADACVHNILGIEDPVDYGSIPMVLYTNPEAAWVGETLKCAEENGHDCAEYMLPLRHSGRYLAENEGSNGLCKAVIDKQSGRLLGLQMVGNHSSEVIYGVGMMIQSSMAITDVDHIVFPHPTVSEIIKDVLTQAPIA